MKLFVSISPKPIFVKGAIGAVASKKAGGTAVFIGTVRDSSRGMRKVTAMEIEAELDMAKKDLARIGKAAAERYEALKIFISHRVGRLVVGDVIVVIAVSAPHRKDAFSACGYILEEMKKTTPIWKEEFSGKRSRWVEPEG